MLAKAALYSHRFADPNPLAARSNRPDEEPPARKQRLIALYKS
ncbi:hypothetical protein HM1_0219 [Heliomicrobium modesticaldum Ice1]|uniref:Uncharacterized protein n=1 Tax=Heliobacterium modesticaldum (strain ATCC 51547 / Ice1) TaxID=498761 RepID=B0TDX5_HELMI|nr:hypothetical protein HM1_0219 [Heliomicrobium modesticaldum Ice1]